MRTGHFLNAAPILTRYSLVRQGLNHTHFIDEKTEAPKGSRTCSKSQSAVWWSWYSNPGCLGINEGVDEKVNGSLTLEHSRQGLRPLTFAPPKVSEFLSPHWQPGLKTIPSDSIPRSPWCWEPGIHVHTPSLPLSGRGHLEKSLSLPKPQFPHS